LRLGLFRRWRHDDVGDWPYDPERDDKSKLGSSWNFYDRNRYNLGSGTCRRNNDCPFVVERCRYREFIREHPTELDFKHVSDCDTFCRCKHRRDDYDNLPFIQPDG